jgi:hypothetical protein
MQEQHLFEYAVIRLVPKVEREEFINVGVIMYCRGLKFLKAKVALDQAKLQLFAGEIDLPEIEEHLQVFCRISRGDKDSGPIGQLELHERFRWLTAMRSTMVQTSRVHPGFCSDAGQTLVKLFDQLVA